LKGVNGTSYVYMLAPTSTPVENTVRCGQSPFFLDGTPQAGACERQSRYQSLGVQTSAHFKTNKSIISGN
jgi:hypothetical protein